MRGFRSHKPATTGVADRANRRKAFGVHYTPRALADFLAARLTRRMRSRHEPPLRILDPACGDGVLLEALLAAVSERVSPDRLEVVGVESDPQALLAAKNRLSSFTNLCLTLKEADFLQVVSGREDQRSLWETANTDSGFDSSFDVVIANPPYVRTQQLGSERAQELARRYGLKGRVDLYHAFLVAATQTLRPEGQLGIILSNRFLTTLAGKTVRAYLANHYHIQEVIDLGDTKLFEAAVLPSILIARRQIGKPVVENHPRFFKVYACRSGEGPNLNKQCSNRSVLSLLSSAREGVFETQEGVFRISRGSVDIQSDGKDVWSLTTRDEADWLRRVERGSAGMMSDLAEVHVGIKTTADEVFIRRDWESLPSDHRPESELLYPLLRHEDVHRWAMPQDWRPSARILYPHEVSHGRRRAVNLEHYPQATAYLERHRHRLEKREYVLAAGRKWYEIWVPQDPDAWAKPKIIFPDIRPEPQFYLDLDGNLVDGDCYWMTLRRGVPEDLLYLILAIANSTLATRFHDLKFPNRLYSGRRRYISQYVSKYPYPNPSAPESRRIIHLTKHVVQAAKRYDAKQVEAIALELNHLIYKAFGLPCDGGVS